MSNDSKPTWVQQETVKAIHRLDAMAADALAAGDNDRAYALVVAGDRLTDANLRG